MPTSKNNQPSPLKNLADMYYEAIQARREGSTEKSKEIAEKFHESAMELLKNKTTILTIQDTIFNDERHAQVWQDIVTEPLGFGERVAQKLHRFAVALDNKLGYDKTSGAANFINYAAQLMVPSIQLESSMMGRVLHESAKPKNK